MHMCMGYFQPDNRNATTITGNDFSIEIAIGFANTRIRER